jgi:TatD DNase family protein
MPGTNLETSRAAAGIARQYPDFLYAAVGIHPEDIEETSQHPNEKTSQQDNIPTDEHPNRSAAWENLQFRIQNLEKLIRENRDVVVAIGEIGTDTHAEQKSQIPSIKFQTDQQSVPMKIQQAYFRAQCELALELDLPIIVHTRESLGETLAVLDTLPQMPRGQFHCFSYDEAGLQEILKRGFFVSLCGNVSWSKRLRKLSAQIPLARLLLETDSPFMTPLEKKPAENESAYVTIAAQILAEEREIPLAELAQVTSENARQLFRL